MLGLGVLAAACDDGGDDESSSTTTEVISARSATTTIPDRQDDGRLKIGLLLPRSGLDGDLGQALFDAARNAIDSINEAGGVRRQAIVPVPAEEGDTPEDTAQTIQELIDQNVDAVVGPARSTSALATLDLLLGAGVLTCSPTATTLALDNYPNRDLFFRTAPSDSLQALALAQRAERTGQRSVAITWLDDVYGRPFSTAVGNSMSSAIQVVSRQPFTADSDLDDVAATVLAEEPGVIVVIADGDVGTRMIQALADAVVADPDDETLPAIIVNDAMRRLSPEQRQRIAELPASVRASIEGASPEATAEGDLPGAYASNAFDCVTLIALAAHEVGPDDTLAMRGQLTELTSTGGVCRDFATCVENLERSLNIDYEGSTGPVDLGADGDLVRARFDIFEYTEEGVDRSKDLTSASR